MKKITRVEIENFQSHEHSIVDFAVFNVIVGHTDSGKSAIIRAIKWCLYNTPDGQAFVRQGAEKATITITFDDETKIVRSKGKKTNFYELTSQYGDVLHLEAFGVGPVKEVLDFHGMREVAFLGGKQSLNICEQHDQPFFLSSSPGERATMIGQMAKADVIDLAIKTVMAEAREVKAQLKMVKGQLSEVKVQLKEYSDLPKLEIVFEKLKNLSEKIDERQNLKVKVSSIGEAITASIEKEKYLLPLIQSYDLIVKTLNNVDELIRSKASVDEKEARGLKLLRDRQRAESLAKSLEDIDSEGVTAAIDSLSELLKSASLYTAASTAGVRLKANTSRLETISFDPTIFTDMENTIAKLYDLQLETLRIVSAEEKAKPLRYSLGRKADGDKYLVNANANRDTALQKYKEALSESPQCPTCLSDIDKDTMSRIEKL